MTHCHICGQPLDELPCYMDQIPVRIRCRLCVEATAERVDVGTVLEALMPQKRAATAKA